MLIAKKNSIVFIAILALANSFGQQKKATSLLQFHSINHIGLLEGQAGSAFQLQTINGAQYKSWFAGVGLGLDYYRFRTIPLFIDLRKEFGKSNNKLFVYADAGINFYWKRDKDNKQFPFDDKMKNGFLGEAGIGYKFRISSKSSLLLSIAYSYKKLIEKGEVYYLYPIDPLILPGGGASYPIEKINYNLNRIVIKAGFEF